LDLNLKPITADHFGAMGYRAACIRAAGRRI